VGAMVATVSCAGSDRDDAAAMVGTCCEIGTDNYDWADNVVRIVRKKANKNSVWGHCTSTNATDKARIPSHMSLIKYCCNNGIHVILNGRAKAMTIHMLESRYAPFEVKRCL